MTFDARQRYEETEERLKEIMDYILEKDDWITTYQIEKSPKHPSKSLYVRIFKDDIQTCLRISDHHTKLSSEGGGMETLILVENMRNCVVYEKLLKKVKDLKYKYKRVQQERLFEKIKGDTNHENDKISK